MQTASDQKLVAEKAWKQGYLEPLILRLANIMSVLWSHKPDPVTSTFMEILVSHALCIQAMPHWNAISWMLNPNALLKYFLQSVHTS